MLRSDVGEGADVGAAARLAEEVAGAAGGDAVMFAPGSVVAAEATGSVDAGDVAGDWLPPHAANDDSPKKTALAVMLMYVQAFMGRL